MRNFWTHLTVVSSLPLLAVGFKDSHPFLAWSSPASSVLEALFPQDSVIVQSNEGFRMLVDSATICEYDAVVFIEQPGLHASDLRNLPEGSYLAEAIKSAASSVNIPYMQQPSAHGTAKQIAEKCNWEYKEIDMGEAGSSAFSCKKVAITIELPELRSVGRTRKDFMVHIDSLLSNHLPKIAASYPSHIFAFVGTSPSEFSPIKRQLADVQRALPEAFGDIRAPTASNSAKPKSGILHRYQLLTPGLISSLGIAFLVIAPLMLMVVNALASIKSPVRSEGIKHSQDKKTQ